MRPSAPAGTITSSAAEPAMKLLIVVAVLAALVLAGRAVLKLRGNRLVDSPVGTLATIRVPARLDPWALRTNWLGAHLRMSRFMNSIRAMGSSTPTHEDLLVSQVVPSQLSRLGDSVVRHIHGAYEHLEDVAWEPVTPRVGGTLRVGTARYTPNGLDDPAWLVEAVDRERGVVVGYRGLQRQVTREEAVAVVDTALTSYTLSTDLATWFGSIERDLGGGMFISLPVELFDPYMLEADSTGVRWMLYRHHPEAAEDPAILERALAVAAFFAPGNPAQESAARAILQQEVLREATITVGPEIEPGGIAVTLVRHASAGRAESAWLVTGFDGARGVGVSLRLWQHDATRQDAVAIVERALASYRFEGDPEWFAPPGGSP